jgi:hypothetical protein
VVVVVVEIVVVVVVESPPAGAEALWVGSPGPATVVDVNEPPTVVEVVVVGPRGIVVVVVAGIVVVVVVGAGIVVVVVGVGGGTYGGAKVVTLYTSVSAPLPKLVTARNSTGYSVEELSPVIVSGDVTKPTPKLVHVVPPSVDHSYAVMAEPPLSPAENDNCNELNVATCELMVGALASIALISKDRVTFVAARWFVASGADAVMVHVPASFIVMSKVLVVQMLVVSLTMVTVASDVEVGSTANAVTE